MTFPRGFWPSKATKVLSHFSDVNNNFPFIPQIVDWMLFVFLQPYCSFFVWTHHSTQKSSYLCHFSKSQQIYQEDNVKAVFSWRPKDILFFFCSVVLWRSGWSWLNSGQKASVTQQHLFLLLSFSQHAEGHAGSPKGGLLCAPLSIPSLSAEVCSHNAIGL